MSTSDPAQLRTLLSKSADYIEALERENAQLLSEKVAAVAKQQDDDATAWAQKLSQVVGGTIDTELAKKIAATQGPEIKDLLLKIASPPLADSLGASARGSAFGKATSDDPDAQFLNYILS